MPQPSWKGVENPLHVMWSHHIHQLERSALERVDKIYICVPWIWHGIIWASVGFPNPSRPNLVVIYKQSPSHMTYLMSTEGFFMFTLVLQCALKTCSHIILMLSQYIVVFISNIPHCCSAVSKSSVARREGAAPIWILVRLPGALRRESGGYTT